ncbi:hypothetical protein CcaverHIS002_0204670 [Cutaneotrichosporon cavernicola]|uniref:Disintegrin and metalloproteinase domain-containing protein B n=1 Tax=Cutaneotrichosporon cavernicola TaxID=279322 RepID=A0AA48IDM3_9TREE|nr:uncharacterized protein CcaverHIS019_0204630 [Cutaneotrichosporon cavernicola]BEI81307.1 hypothetical protein CcaverHIS002_0204670 [Cutaneotrichosporon cavernicola]BEI89101.1 hypothetical protein CcaverHIS019_0204630 [Cutaneotrichosporon cavernicola]BEI96877.1 hypothetical protein CcaverHIS631_0204660 [Cutaneotrichosporon cavernicola]BEJ04649.1 hypothetical protein CcaverHIS641_0204660 [Cutaneotrichosporon cavernicola]
MAGSTRLPPVLAMALLALAMLLLAGSANARSVHPPPVRRVHHPSRSTVRIVPRGDSLSRRSISPQAHSLRHDDSLLLTASVASMAPYEVALLLRPTEHLFHPDAKVTFQHADGSSTSESLRAEDWRLYQGEVVRPAWIERVWAEELSGLEHSPAAFLGRASVMVHDAGDNIRWEGTFSIDGINYHVLTKERYEATRTMDDADVAAFGNGLVIFSDAEMEYKDGTRHSNSTGCTHDRLTFNTDPSHPVLRRRDANMLLEGRGSRDDMGGMTPKTNYIESIGSDAGCPTSQQVVYMGVAVDCNYVTAYGSKDAARTQVLNNWNQITALYRSTFRVSLGIIELVVEEAQCPSSPPADKQWNQNCTQSVTLDDRLSMFSQWRGKKGNDGAGLWHLMTACSTDTEVGVAWLGTLCQTSANEQDGQQFVSGTGVSSASKTEWNLISHEIGHNFGAIHDCIDGCTLQSSCCPYSRDACTASGRFIMNPTTAASETAFSQCTLGNVCSFLGTGSKNCVVTPDPARTTISLKQCGNGIVEQGEECDPGMNSTSSCCDPNTCKFINGAVCDPTNSACCTDQCTYKAAGVVCRPSINAICDTQEVCSGNTGECPKDVTAKDGTNCGNGLQCASGHCTSLDEQCVKAGASLNLTQACSARDDQSCYVTCKDPNVANQCTILQTVLIDGSPCGYGGHCYNGTCSPGSWQNRLASMYTQNLQIAIPVTIAVAIIVGMILYSIARCCCGAFTRSRSKPKKQAWDNGVSMAPYPQPAYHSQSRGQDNNPTQFRQDGSPTREFRQDGSPTQTYPALPLLDGHRRNVSGSYSDEMGTGQPVRPAYADPYAPYAGRRNWVDESRYNGRDTRDQEYEEGYHYNYDESVPRHHHDARENRGYSRQ